MHDDRALVSAQIGRTPRDPWRVAVRCPFGRPSAIASPPLLDDGVRFPTWLWLTCPYLSREVALMESRGDTSAWAARASGDPDLAARLEALDAEVRRRRAREGGGEDVCADVGVAGQRDPLGVKCLHAHVAYSLAGLDDPVGCAILEDVGRACSDRRCERLR